MLWKPFLHVISKRTSGDINNQEKMLKNARKCFPLLVGVPTTPGARAATHNLCRVSIKTLH